MMSPAFPKQPNAPLVQVHVFAAPPRDTLWYKQNSLANFIIFTIYQNNTLAFSFQIQVSDIGKKKKKKKKKKKTPSVCDVIVHILRMDLAKVIGINKILHSSGVYSFFTRITYQSNTHAHKAIIIPSIYTTGILHFPTLSNSRCSWIFFGQRWIFENVKKITRRGKNLFFGHNFSYCRIWSPNFACRVGLKCFSSDITENFCCFLVFEKTQL